jgi:hypothetical protein
MTRQPRRGDLVTSETAAHAARLKTGRAQATAADLHSTSAALESARTRLRQGRAGLDVAAIERLRTPS